MLSSGMLRREALVTTDVSEESIAPLISVEIISKLGTLAVINNGSKLRRNTRGISSQRASVAN
jgi:hypothetical protein